jgi:hypothetical protein
VRDPGPERVVRGGRADTVDDLGGREEGDAPAGTSQTLAQIDILDEQPVARVEAADASNALRRSAIAQPDSQSTGTIRCASAPSRGPVRSSARYLRVAALDGSSQPTAPWTSASRSPGILRAEA